MRVGMDAVWVESSVSVLAEKRVHRMVGELVDSWASRMVVFESVWMGAVACDG